MIAKKNAVVWGALAVVVAALTWSIDQTFLRPHLFALPAPLVVLLEHGLGFVVLLPFLFAYRRELRNITHKQWVTIFWVALFGGALGTTFFTKALFLTGFTDISVVILLQKLQPIFAILLAGIVLHERFPARFYLYAGVAIVGGYLITFKDPFTISHVATTTLTIAGYSILAAFAWGSSTTFGKYSLKNINFGLLAALRFAFTVLIMLVLAAKDLSAIVTVQPIHWEILLVIVFTSGAAAMYLYYFGLKRISASVSSLCELAWPFSAVIFDYFINHTVLSTTQYLGGAMLVVAVYFATRGEKHYTITGVVERGQGKGDTTGAKTANLPLSLATFPKGLYLSSVEFDGAQHQGLLYYGINILSNKDCLEVHLLNYNGDLYGKTITVTTDRYIRFPKRFASVEALAAQIGKDLKVVSKL